MSRSYDYDLICIGSGPAGQRAAVQAAKLHKRVAIVEREMEIGGVCLHTGTIPSKTFREAVLSFCRKRDDLLGAMSGNDLNPPVERATIAALLSRVGAIVEAETRVQRTQLFRNGVDVVRGTAAFTDPHTLAVRSSSDAREISAETMLIAVGSRARRESNLDGDPAGVITSDDIFALETLPRSVVVIGCGVIGVEYASMFAALGIEVTVVEGRERPLEFLDFEIVDDLTYQLRKRGVTFRFGETVTGIETRDDGPRRTVVQLRSGKRLAGDLALACTGRVGASDTLNLAAAGLSADERGRIEVDESYRSAVPHEGGRVWFSKPLRIVNLEAVALFEDTLHRVVPAGTGYAIQTKRDGSIEDRVFASVDGARQEILNRQPRQVA